MLYVIEIGLERFDITKHDEVSRMFEYCEVNFGFKGQEWEEIKNEFDYETMGEKLESISVDYQEIIE